MKNSTTSNRVGGIGKRNDTWVDFVVILIIAPILMVLILATLVWLVWLILAGLFPGTVPIPWFGAKP